METLTFEPPSPNAVSARPLIDEDIDVCLAESAALSERLKGKVSLLSQTYEREIARLAELLAYQCGEVHRLKSLLPPISHIPPEILAEIFVAYVREVRPQFQYRHIDVAPFSWIRIMHVCQKWRDVALNTPRLWTWIVPTRRQCISHVIAHSGSLPLTVRYQHSNPKVYPHIHELLFSQLPRIRTAQIKITAAVVEALGSRKLCILEAPLMEELDVELLVAANSIPKLSTMALPRLATLSMTGVGPTLFQSLLRPTLTRLTMTNCPLVDAIELTRVSSYFRSLRQLFLTNVGGRDLLLSLPPSRSGLLPQLEELYLSYSNSVAGAHMYNHMDFPSTTTVTLRFNTLHSIAVSSIAAKMANMSLRPATIYIDTFKHNVIRLWDTSIPWLEARRGYPKKPSAARLTLYIPPTQTIFTTNKHMSGLFDKIDLSDLTTLCIVCPPANWHQMFRSVSKLQELDVEGTGVDHFQQTSGISMPDAGTNIHRSVHTYTLNNIQ